ncbi:unnamed protein product, partial [Mesorhabditis belari]|uniref:Uncharacterized protein n=1 Tax=Mesorhabditis belari TaxID=2138241 RepID=A0AAF3EMJ2_9BILA
MEQPQSRLQKKRGWKRKDCKRNNGMTEKRNDKLCEQSFCQNFLEVFRSARMFKRFVFTLDQLRTDYHTFMRYRDCGACCQELTDAAKTIINRRFFTTFPVLGEKATPHDRSFLFIQTTSSVISENLEEIALDVESLDSKTKRIHLKHEACQQQSEYRNEESTKNGCIRIVPFNVSSKD